MDWTKLGRQRYRHGSTAPAPAPTSAHSRQQITNVEAISGRTAVLPLTWAATSLEQLESRFILPPPAPQHNPSASASSYSCCFLAQHPELPETMAPTTRDQLATCFIIPPSGPQYTPLALPLSSGTYFSGRSSEKHPENCVVNWKDLDNYHQRTAAFYHAVRIRSPTGRKARFSDNISRMLLPPA